VVIVPAKTTVTIEVLNMLARHSIMEVVVGEESDEPELSLEDFGILDDALGMIDYLEERERKQDTFEDVFSAAVEEIKIFFEQLLAGQDVDIYQLLEIVATVVEKADNNVNLFQMLYKKMNRDSEDIYEHCINVSLYAQLLAKWADLTAEEVELAGIAGVLHDIGLIVCYKQGEKNISLHGEYENKCGFNHMVHSYNLIKDMDVDVRLKQAILTHHERMDLSGFPNQLSYKSLNYVSRVVAIADAFATLTMKEDGVDGMKPLNAMCHMFDTGYIKFDTELLICFIEHVVQNFIQYEVLLSDGQRGKIVMPNKKEPARPVIMMSDGSIVDLAVRKDLSITDMFY
jgi:putative nucleotidyltransferase with HDIG domain